MLDQPGGHHRGVVGLVVDAVVGCRLVEANGVARHAAFRVVAGDIHVVGEDLGMTRLGPRRELVERRHRGVALGAGGVDGGTAVAVLAGDDALPEAGLDRHRDRRVGREVGDRHGVGARDVGRELGELGRGVTQRRGRAGRLGERPVVGVLVLAVEEDGHEHRHVADAHRGRPRQRRDELVLRVVGPGGRRDRDLEDRGGCVLEGERARAHHPEPVLQAAEELLAQLDVGRELLLADRRLAEHMHQVLAVGRARRQRDPDGVGVRVEQRHRGALDLAPRYGLKRRAVVDGHSRLGRHLCVERRCAGDFDGHGDRVGGCRGGRGVTHESAYKGHRNQRDVDVEHLFSHRVPPSLGFSGSLCSLSYRSLPSDINITFETQMSSRAGQGSRGHPGAAQRCARRRDDERLPGTAEGRSRDLPSEE